MAVRALCSKGCGLFALKKDGTIRKHSHYPMTFEGVTGAQYWYRGACEGSGQPPLDGFRADRYHTWTETS